MEFEIEISGTENIDLWKYIRYWIKKSGYKLTDDSHTKFPKKTGVVYFKYIWYKNDSKPIFEPHKWIHLIRILHKMKQL